MPHPLVFFMSKTSPRAVLSCLNYSSLNLAPALVKFNIYTVTAPLPWSHSQSFEAQPVLELVTLHQSLKCQDYTFASPCPPSVSLMLPSYIQRPHVLFSSGGRRLLRLLVHFSLTYLYASDWPRMQCWIFFTLSLNSLTWCFDPVFWISCLYW